MNDRGGRDDDEDGSDDCSGSGGSGDGALVMALLGTNCTFHAA